MQMLASAVAAARRRIAPLLLWIVLCFTAALLYIYVTPASFTASATVILDPKRSNTAIGDGTLNTPLPVLDVAAAESQIQVIRSERLLSSVFDALDLANAASLQPGPPSFISRVIEQLAGLLRAPHQLSDKKSEREAAAFDAFTGRVSARRVGQSYVLEVSYTSYDPTESRKLANAVVSGYLGQQVSFKLAAAQNGAEYLQGRVNTLNNELKAANAGVLAGTVPSILLPDADARVIGAALQPLGRSAPKSGLVVGLAVVSGLLSGLFGVAILNRLDDRVRSARQIERATGLPCLGAIPDVRRRKSSMKRSILDMTRLVRQDPGGRFAESMRDTRTSILLMLAGKREHAIGITSWREGEGRSLIASNLSQIIAMSGSPVTLVDAEIHQLTSSLTSTVAPVSFSLTESLLDATGNSLSDSVMLETDLVFVPARSGDHSEGYRAYLGAPGLPKLIETWRAQGNVIVDLPALGSSGDARAAAACLDGVVIVVEVGRSTIDDVEHAMSALLQAGATVIGTVLNKIDR